MKEFQWDVRNRVRMGRFLTSTETQLIHECLRNEPDVHSILDVGGGAGRFAIPLETQGYSVTVMDIDLLALSWLKVRSSNTNAVQVSSQSRVWPIMDSAVDCVLSIEVPIVESSWFWQECRRVLKPTGIVIAWMTNKRSYKGMIYSMRRFIKSCLSMKFGEWENRFYIISVREATNLIEANEFQLRSVRGYNWIPGHRESDSFMIPLYAAIEQRLGLRKLASLSPWVLLKAICTKEEGSNAARR